jgi:hypothetical protein
MLILMLPQISAHPCIDDDIEPTISLFHAVEPGNWQLREACFG